MSARTVAIVGASGLVGRECVRQFAAHGGFSRVTAIVRRPLAAELMLPRVEAALVDFEHLAAAEEHFRTSHLVCALGTTIRQAGSQDRFRAVDFGYALAAASLARASGARHFLLVSALGADPGSRVFYNRVKGELEAAVGSLGFPSLTIVRPSLLLGERAERRVGEIVARWALKLAPPKYRGVEARAVATALLQAALEDRPGIRIIESREIRERAR